MVSSRTGRPLQNLQPQCGQFLLETGHKFPVVGNFKCMRIYTVIEDIDSLLKIVTMFQSNVGLIEATVRLIPRSKEIVMGCGCESVVSVVR